MVRQGGLRFRLTNNILRYSICILQYIRESLHETRRQTSISSCGGRFAARLGPPDDPAGVGSRHEARRWARLEPGLRLADREWSEAAPDAHHARAACAVLPGLPGVPGGRSGRLHTGLAVGIASDRRESGFVARDFASGGNSPHSEPG